MKGLCTARVVVIDDVPREAMPIIQALGRLGVGCVHVKGDELEALPKSPLCGIRLVFLDMKLGTAQGARGTGAQTANVFAKVIAVDTAPLLVVFWTQHPEYIEEFKVALFAENPGFRRGVLFTTMDKPTALKVDEIPSVTGANEKTVLPADEDNGLSGPKLEQIKADIEKVISDFPPLEVAWTCEQLAHDATTSTTRAIAAIVARRSKITDSDGDEDRKKKWLNSLSHLYQSLILASAGKSSTPATAMEDLLGAVVEIYRDRLDSLAFESRADLSYIFTVPWGGPDDSERADLNTMFLTAKVEDEDTRLRPGNVYGANKELVDSCPHRLCQVDSRSLVEELIKVGGYKEVGSLKRNISDYLKRTPVPTVQMEKDQQSLEGLLVEIASFCIPILLEITPACDYAQRNQKVARFVGGLLVKQDPAIKICSGESIKDVGEIRVGGSNDIWHVVLSARFIFSIPGPSNNIKATPLFRLRSGALMDIQAWCASHAARPGYLKADKR